MRAASTRVPFVRRVLGVGLAGALIGVAGLTAPAEAAPRQYVVTYYYDDAGNHVGTSYVNCSPPYVVKEGTITDHYTIVAEGPC